MILALVMALALVACGNKNTDDGKKDNPDDNKTPTVITNPDKVQDEMTSDRKSTRLNSSHTALSRMPSSA